MLITGILNRDIRMVGGVPQRNGGDLCLRGTAVTVDEKYSDILVPGQEPEAVDDFEQEKQTEYFERVAEDAPVVKSNSKRIKKGR